jgi:aspartate-semialdehyde dehydrogenase
MKTIVNFNARVAVVGATGSVGQEFQKIFQTDPELKNSKPLWVASVARPEQNVLSFEESLKGPLQDCKYILNATGNDVAEKIKENLGEEQVLIDNSSAFRMDPSTPLVVPEINGDLVSSGSQIFANPNCTAILLCMTLNVLKAWGLARVIVSTYQAASGAGIKGLMELEAQIKTLAQGQKPTGGEIFKFPLAGNIMSHNSEVRPQGEMGALYNEEEWKVIEETRKILEIRSLPISVTSMRVPVQRAHTESVTVDLKQEVSILELKEAFAKASGIQVIDEPEKNHFPMPLEAENQDSVLVGRFRKDVTLGKTLHYILAGDQLRKGAALNAVQIMKHHLMNLKNSSN